MRSTGRWRSLRKSGMFLFFMPKREIYGITFREKECPWNACRRMAEFDPFGMQKQPPAGCSVQSVARDRSIESRWMGRMDAQLVRAAGQRVEGDAGAAVPEFQHFVLRDRRLSVQGIDRLSGTVVEVRSQG